MNAPLVCADGVRMLMDYSEGVLSPADRSVVDAHVAGCPRCVAFVKSYVETPRILRAATAALMPAEVAVSLRRFLAARRR
jgi:anti-sigma factor RsiW